jgi:phage tail sheath protein FI
LSDAVDRGITVTEIAAMGQSVDACPETTAAFVGRALRGPLNTPVMVSNFAEFRRRFGDVWGRSSLGPAAKQFFQHGGKRLYVVRVANSARGAMLCLPASGSALVLRAVEPGSTESIRAAVDYDAIDDEDSDRFNLTLQRVDPTKGLVVDQEFFQNLSWINDADKFVADELLASRIVRAEQPYPTHRPERTLAFGRSYESSYIDATQAGTDGVGLSNYDLIGARRDRSGIFALEQVEHFDLLYIPPPGKGKSVGPAATLAAEMYGRERGAMVVVDPLSEWTSAELAIRGVRELGYASPNLIGYFPPVSDRDSEDSSPRAAGGAIAGLLCKQDRLYGPWHSLELSELGLNRRLRPAIEISSEDEDLLHRAGLNVLTAGCGVKTRVSGSVTMGRGSEAHRKFSQLPVRRFCLQLITTIARATRWAVFEADDSSLADRIREQVLAYFQNLSDLGAFVDDRFIVQCDAGVSKRTDVKEHGVTLLLVFHPAGCDQPLSLTLHQTASGIRVGSTAFGLSLHP